MIHMCHRTWDGNLISCLSGVISRPSNKFPTVHGLMWWTLAGWISTNHRRMVAQGGISSNLYSLFPQAAIASYRLRPAKFCVSATDCQRWRVIIHIPSSHSHPWTRTLISSMFHRDQLGDHRRSILVRKRSLSVRGHCFLSVYCRY